MNAMQRLMFCLTLPAAIGQVWAQEYQTIAPYLTEEEAIRAGERIGIGAAILEGPATVEVRSHQTWTLVYTAGKAGIKPGGGIRIAMRHNLQWSPPQGDTPKQVGYTTVTTSNGAVATTYFEFNTHSKRFFRQYHPWQNILEVTLPEQGLAPGDEIRIIYGDRSGASPGIRVQPIDEHPFTFKLYVDAFGEGDYLPLRNNPTINIIAAEPFRMNVVTPSNTTADQPTWCIVRVEDRYGNPATSYRGTITLSTQAADAILPGEYTFQETDQGVHRFEGITLPSQPDAHRITATAKEFSATSNPILIRQPNERLLLWGDLHGHTLNSDGRGTVEQFYDYAENVAGLDFCAVTDHAFEVLDHMWAHSKKVTNAVYQPGKFVTFQAYEWSGQTDVGGDHNVFFLEDDPPIYRSRSYYEYRNLQMYHGPEAQVNHVEDLFATLANNYDAGTVFCIPHYGGRRGNPDWHNPRVQRMIEVFSEHRRSEDWMTPFLQNRYRLGIIASTDGHFGNPGYGYLKPNADWSKQEIGMASVAVYAKERTRESIFEALFDRRCYATSGERIVLNVQADSHPMGSEFKATTAPTISIEAVGTNRIARVEIKKNSEVIHTIEPNELDVKLEWQDPAFDPDKETYYYIRIVQTDNEEAISSPIWVN